MLHIFGEDYATSSLFGHAQYQRIPIRKSMEPVQINGSDNVADSWLCHIEHSEDFNFPACCASIKSQLAAGRNKVLLEHLQRDYSCSRTRVLVENFQSLLLFGRF